MLIWTLIHTKPDAGTVSTAQKYDRKNIKVLDIQGFHLTATILKLNPPRALM